jgi:hypothetical protein
MGLPPSGLLSACVIYPWHQQTLKGYVHSSQFLILAVKNVGKAMKIYVAGPYTPVDSDLHDAVRQANQNTIRAIDVGIELIKKGHYPFIPHLTHFIHMQSQDPLSKEFYRSYDMIWLAYCDALYFIGRSEGANRERKWAQQHKLRIFTAMSQVPRVIVK